MKALLALLVLCNFAFAREFNTERPDKARLAYTLEEKKLAFEPEFINYSTHAEENKTDTEFGEIFLRYGLTNDLEVQLVSDSYVQSEKRGFQNTEVALKQNILGNDDGDVALAVIPYFRERAEGGLALAMDSYIYNRYYFSVTLEANTYRRDPKLDWQSNYVSVVSVGQQTLSDIYLYLEVANESGLNEEQGNITTLDLAVQYEINPKLRFDVGTFIGLSPDADDLQTFAGAAFLLN